MNKTPVAVLRELRELDRVGVYLTRTDYVRRVVYRIDGLAIHGDTARALIESGLVRTHIYDRAWRISDAGRRARR